MRTHELRGWPGLLTTDELNDTVQAIVSVQQPSGSLPWPDGHTDAWDHVECAMALTVGGHYDEAITAYEWLRKTQAADGSWAMAYDELVVTDASVDTNQCAYIAVGAWHWWTVTGDRTLPEQLWPHTRRALNFVLDMQKPGGDIRWGRDPHGEHLQDSLLTGSSSIYQALRCGIALAELMDEPQPEWELAAGQLQHAVAQHPDVFLDKSRFSMDWYYPVLGGSVRGAAARALIDARWAEFVVPGLGIRCVSDRPWVTGAETAELAISLIVTDGREQAIELLRDSQHLRETDGSYWTGLVFDEGVRWPGERSSWTAAAMVLACDSLHGGPTFDLFSGHDLPTGVAIPHDICNESDAHCRDAWSRVSANNA